MFRPIAAVGLRIRFCKVWSLALFPETLSRQGAGLLDWTEIFEFGVH